MRVLVSKINREALEALRALVDGGVVVPHVDQTYPLADTAVALQALRAAQVRGKAVIIP